MTYTNKGLAQRIAGYISDYDAQGIHRTGTEVDLKSAAWLSDLIKGMGLEAKQNPLPFERINILKAQITVEGRRLEGVPMFDCGAYTDSKGITGKLGGINDSDADIGVGLVPPLPSDDGAARFTEARKTRGFKAMVSITTGPSDSIGLFLMNAFQFIEPFGPPVLQVSSHDIEWLQQAVRAGKTATVSAYTERVATEAFNVETRVQGTDRTLAPLVVFTPRSGWWQCASERGGGIAAWLELVRAIQQARPKRDVIFIANTGHELHHLGMNHFLASHPTLLKDAFAWIHLGANFAAVENTVAVISSNEELKESFVELVPGIDMHAAVGRPFGEAIPIYENR
ncbi:MAG: M28 family peptidase, partial [Deltaproteobacteria bacterium]|nr:M28 family peptidase [Deltaproteobacteria bacterium]